MRAVLAASLLALLLLAGCSSTSSGGVTPPTDAQGRHVISMTSGNMFTPMHAKVPLNATVVWKVDGGVHDVSAMDKSFDSDNTVAAGGLGCKMGASGCATEFSHHFHTAGKFEYECEIHASTGMKGSITVA